MRRLVFVIASLLVAACSAPQKERASEFFNLVEPLQVSDIGIDGHQVVLPQGRALIVRLPEDPASDQRWEMLPFESSIVVAPVKRDLIGAVDPTGAAVATTADNADEALFRLRGIAPGTQPIVIEYRRPFETTASKSVRFDVVVQ